MADYESEVATFLTLDGHVFISPQYNIAFNEQSRDGGSCPDFVAIDMKSKEVIVVEVTSSSSTSSLASRIKERNSRWYGPISHKLTELGVIREDWRPIRFLGFVRENNLERLRSEFRAESDVAFCAIEEVTFLWKYWDKRILETGYLGRVRHRAVQRSRLRRYRAD